MVVSRSWSWRRSPDGVTVRRRFSFSLCTVPPEFFLHLNLQGVGWIRVRKGDKGRITRSLIMDGIESGNNNLSSYCRRSEFNARVGVGVEVEWR